MPKTHNELFFSLTATNLGLEEMLVEQGPSVCMLVRKTDKWGIFSRKSPTPTGLLCIRP